MGRLDSGPGFIPARPWDLKEMRARANPSMLRCQLATVRGWGVGFSAPASVGGLPTPPNKNEPR
jgi:hypothetical protein